MNILLAYICYPPESEDPYGSRLPTGLGYLASTLLAAGYSVVVKNFSTTGLRGLKRTLKQKFDVAGFTLFTFNRQAVFDSVKLIKETDPAIETIVGGPHCTALKDDFPSKYPYIDHAVYGPGEDELIKLLHNLEPKTQSSFGEDIKPNAIGSLDRYSAALAGTDVSHPRSSREQQSNLDYLGSPSKGLFESGVTDEEEYIYLNSSRGCPGKCTFCSSPSFWKNIHAFHSIEWVLQELDFRINKMGCNFISFRDESFSTDPERIRKLCSKIINNNSLNFLWDCQCRADQVDLDTMLLMAAAGCRTVQLGIEHGSEEMRRLLGKPCSDKDIIKATGTIRNAGMEPSWYLITAIPGETKADRQKTRELIKKAKPVDTVVSPLSLYPGTALFNLYNRQKKLPTDFWFRNKSSWVLAVPGKEAMAITQREGRAIASITDRFTLTSDEIYGAAEQIQTPGREKAVSDFSTEHMPWPLLWAYSLALANEGLIKKAKEVLCHERVNETTAIKTGNCNKSENKTSGKIDKPDGVDSSNYWLNALKDELE